VTHFRHAAIAAAGGALVTAAYTLSAAALAVGPEIVAGPAADPGCFVPWTDKTKFFKFSARNPPFRVALANGNLANTWRIQMIQTAKAFVAQPDIAAKLKEFKVVSTGEDVAAQIAAVNNFIDFGFDAIVVNAQNPAAFKPVIKRANDAGVVLVAFDNILDTEDAINVDVDQRGLGVYWAKWLDTHLPNGGKILEVRGVSGTSVDRDRHDGIHETLDATGKKWEVIEVFGKWDDATAQKVTADAIAVQKRFDGITSQGGDTGVVQALIDAKHPMVPFGGETENGFRKFCVKMSSQGLLCSSAGPGLLRLRSRSRWQSPRSRGRWCRNRSNCRSRPPKIPTLRTDGTITLTCLTISSSAIPSPPATSISKRRKSRGKPRKTSNRRSKPPSRSGVVEVLGHVCSRTGARPAGLRPSHS
jgi:ribose transport system substrate-binding protein